MRREESRAIGRASSEKRAGFGTRELRVGEAIAQHHGAAWIWLTSRLQRGHLTQLAPSGGLPVFLRPVAVVGQVQT